MLDTGDRLLSSGDSHRDLGILESQEILSQPISVTCGKEVFTAHIQPDGRISVSPKRRRQVWSAESGLLAKLLQLCAVTSPGTQIEGEELIGGIVVQRSFQLWSCSQHGSGKKPTRVLRKSHFYQCESREEAEDFVLRARRQSSWSTSTSAPSIVVIINPHSGTGRAAQRYKEVVRPILAAAGLQVLEHTTTHAGHATAIVQELELSGLRAVVMVGGDGTVWEALQGYMSRPDWRDAVRVPLAQLPAGSGNALAANAGGWSLVTAAWAVCKGRSSPFDVFSVVQPPGKRKFGFLSVAYGMITNLDIGTEHLRWLGPLRFTYGALRQIILRSDWAIRMAYYPLETAAPEVSGTELDGPATPILDALDLNAARPMDNPGSLPQDWRMVPEDTVQMCVACNLPWLDLDNQVAPQAGFSTGGLDLVYTSQMQRWQGLQILLKASDGSHLQVPGVRLIKMKALMLEPLSSGTWLAVDGEAIPRERVYIEVHPGLCQVITA